MKKLLLVFCITLLTVISGLRASAQTFDWSCFPTSGTILADANVIANLNLTNANCSVANGWVLQCQGAGEQRILSSALNGNPYIRMQKVGDPGATFNFARILTASGSLFTLKSISVTPTSVGAAAGGAQVITLHAYKGGHEQGSMSTGLLNSIALVNIPESQLGAFTNIDEIRFTSDKPAAFGVGIDDVVIVTAATAPSVTTDNSAAVTSTTATLTGTVTADGGAAVTEKGIVYATAANPTTANTKLTNGAGTGAISVNASALAGGITYHFRAYAINSIGTTYGADKSFTTLIANQPPVLTATAGTTVFSGENAIIDPGITVSDDGGTLNSGVASITGGLHSAEDRLIFIANGSTGDINGSYSILTGVLTLQSASGTATIAQWQAALRATVYRNIQASPSTNVRTITFSVNDGSLDSNPASKNVSIALPAAVADNYSFKTGVALTIPAPGVLSNDTDAGGNPLSAILVSGPANGTLTLNADGSFTYTSTSTANDQFTYKVNNGNLDGNTVVVTLTHANTAPVAVADLYNYTPGTPLTIAAASGVLGNDTDADGDPLTAVLVSGSSNGTLVLNANGSFTYTPAGAGSDQFTYKANDGVASSNAVTVTLNGVNQPPVVTTTPGPTIYGAVPVIVDPGVTVTDPDNPTLGSAVVYIQTGSEQGDRLGFTPTGDVGNIVFSEGLPGIYSLHSPGQTGTVAQWQNALRSVTYQSTAAGTGDRIINLVLSDGFHNNTVPALKTITYAPSAIGTTGTLSALTTTYGTASSSGTFNVSGIRVGSGILVTAPTGFEVSSDNTTFTPTVTIGAAGNISSTPVYIRLAANANAGTYSGNVVLSSAGVSDVQVATVASTVNRKALTVTAKNITKTYGQALTGGATTTEFTTAGLVGTETVGNVAIAYGPGAAANAAVNTYTGSVVASAAGGGTFTPANYTINYIAGNILVNKAPLTITANNKGKAFGAILTGGAGSTDFTSTGLVGTETIGSVTITYGAGAGAAAPVGPYAGSIVPSAATGGTFNAANYAITYTAGTLTVGQAILTITANNASKIYGAVVPALSVTYSGFVGTDDPSSLTTLPTINTTAVQNSPVNTYPITASGAVSPNYTIVYQPGTLTVTPAALTVTANNATKIYGSVNPALGVSYSGFAGTDNAASLTTAPTVTTAAVVNSPVNTYPVTASGASSSNYTFVYQPGILTVTPAALTVTAINQTKTYGQTLTGGVGSTAFTSNGLVGAETLGSVTITYGTGAAAGDAVNTYTGAIVPSAATGGTFNPANYAINYVAGDITVGKAAITVTAAAGQNKVYGNVDPTLAYAITTGALVGTDTFTGSLTRAPGENAGTYAIQKGSLTLNGNYTLNYVGANFTINKRAITLTANAQNKVYGAADPFLSYSITSGSLAFADTFTGLLTRAPGENAGTYAIQQGGLALSSNYALTYVSADLTIGKAAITVTADAQAKVYGAVDPALTYKVTTGALVGTDAFTGSLTRAPGENAGSYAIQQGTLALNTNYTLTYAGANLTIGKVAITVTADAQAKTYGAIDPALTYKVTTGALVGTDTFTGLLTRVPGENVGTYAIQQGTLVLNTNYTLTYAGANLTIGKAAITVTADAQTKTYGAVDPALTYKVTTGALVGTDTFTGSLTRAPGENVGTYAIQQGTLALNGNYTLAYIGASLTIGKAAITVTADAQTKTYGAIDPALTYKVTNGALKFADTFTGSLTRAPGENVGTYAIQQGTLALNGNYTLAYIGASLTIGKAAITVTADAQTKTYGAIDPALTYKVTNGALKFADTFTGSLTRATGENVGTYAIQQGTLALNGNYTLAYIGASLTIGKAAITVTADAQTKTYGAVDPALTYKVTNGALKFADTFTGSLTRVPGENAGTYAIQQGTLVLNTNYTLTYIGASLSITQKTLTITANNANKTYGSVNPVLTVGYSGFVNGDNSNSLTTQPVITTIATQASAAGTYPITVNGAAIVNYKIVYVPGILTVNKAALTVTAEDKSRLYGEANPAFTTTYSGFVNGDTQAALNKVPVLSTIANSTSLPGLYPITASGAVSANYTFNYVQGKLTVIALSNAKLTNLVPTSGTLNPSFNANNFSYREEIDNEVTGIRLTLTFDPTATAIINGSAAPNNRESFNIPLNIGNNTISIVITAQDRVTTNTYTLVVYRGEDQKNIAASNILSPNGDGKNDTWVVTDIQLYPNNTVTVFDKGGRTVYTKNGYANDWNGTFGGSPLTEGTYYYVIDLGPQRRKFKGFITIIRNR